jgi:hypothetical protein
VVGPRLTPGACFALGTGSENPGNGGFRTFCNKSCISRSGCLGLAVNPCYNGSRQKARSGELLDGRTARSVSV